MTCVATTNDRSALTPVRGLCSAWSASILAYALYGVTSGPNESRGVVTFPVIMSLPPSYP
jgi:hypothetical protein